MDDEKTVRAYYESLPGKRIGAGLVCRDGQGRVLLVKPTYKPAWEVPGGTVEAGESPAAGLAREVLEELGVALVIGRLLVIDWLPVRPPKTEGLMMLFDGGELDESVTGRFVLPPDELSLWAFIAAADLDEALPDPIARRIRVALDLAQTDRSAYLEWGHLLTDSSDGRTKRVRRADAGRPDG